MVSLIVVFGMFVALFGLVGAMRGWAKELLVTSAIVLGLFVTAILENYISPYKAAMDSQPPLTQFIVRAGLLVLLALFGYQSPNIRALQPKLARERLEEILLGLGLGVLNGYLLVGSIWFYLHKTGYPTPLVLPPAEGSDLATEISNLVAYMPPQILPIPQVYFAVGIVFVFIIVVFV
ncbi:MAG TPA: CvpA family protein [Anaerolineales bacterium]|nr:CvpA family protein [Anaerolineales bacterium]